MGKFRAVQTTEGKRSTVAVSEGQMIVTTDEKNIYFDTADGRVDMDMATREYVENALSWKGAGETLGKGSESNQVVITREGKNIHEICVAVMYNSNGVMATLEIPLPAVTGERSNYTVTTDWSSDGNGYAAVTVITTNTQVIVRLYDCCSGGSASTVSSAWMYVYWR